MKKAKKKNVETYETLLRIAAAIVLLALGALMGLAAFADLGGSPLAGPVGSTIFGFAYLLVGIGAFLLPLLMIWLGIYAGFRRPRIAPLTAAGTALILAAVLAFAGLFSKTVGGLAGASLGDELQQFFGFWGALVLVLAIAAAGIVIVSDVAAIVRVLVNALAALGRAIGNAWLAAIARRRERRLERQAQELEDNIATESSETEAEVAPQEVSDELVERDPLVTMFNESPSQARAASPGGIPSFDAEYDAPPLSLLGGDKGKPDVGDIKANANIIKRTFQNFGINVEMDEVSVGPTVTRYAIKPAEGVRLSKIISLQNNLELALAAHPVRIEAPIPGKSLVGIEVPNASKATVGLGGVMGAPEWTKSAKPLLAALGRDITGTPHYVNIAKMPHGLVAGATGSGKSVAMHAIITSLLYRNGPNQLRFIMVDPKRVELTLYNGIPHLLTPVITDSKKAILALKWAAKEMERRYNILEAETVRDIDSYHATVFEPAKKLKGEARPEAMPFIVIVIDELADIMQTYPRELEAAIVRLAQMSRAVGIHLVLSTQRPSVNVITGLIKANVPTRMALQVASQIDSRTILDSGGAEMLLGAGDMLYLSADMQKPVRIQTAYIGEGEVKKVVQYIKKNNAGDLSSLDLGGTGGASEGPNDAILMAGEDDDVDDDLYTQAKAAVEEAGRASTSYLQRKLRIGYSRAARLMDLLEAKGVIGTADGSKPREVLTAAGAAAAASSADLSPSEDEEPSVF
ncbi:MAG: DNA translocase FtsK 4TM domain-containing protein [bacterium]